MVEPPHCKEGAFKERLIASRHELQLDAESPAAQASSATGPAILIRQQLTWHMPAPFDAQTFRSDAVAAPESHHVQC